jgi:molecular chaperone GrpE (heat shock protein)
MDIQTQYDQLEASLTQLKASLSQSDSDYLIVATALKELRRSLVAYNLTRHSNKQMPFDNELHPMTKQG